MTATIHSLDQAREKRARAALLDKLHAVYGGRMWPAEALAAWQSSGYTAAMTPNKIAAPVELPCDTEPK